MEFTERELDLLSNGVLRLLDNAGRARKLLVGCGTKKDRDIVEYMNELKALNSKLCEAMKR